MKIDSVSLSSSRPQGSRGREGERERRVKGMCRMGVAARKTKRTSCEANTKTKERGRRRRETEREHPLRQRPGPAAQTADCPTTWKSMASRRRRGEKESCAWKTGGKERSGRGEVGRSSGGRDSNSTSWIEEQREREGKPKEKRREEQARRKSHDVTRTVVKMKIIQNIHSLKKGGHNL
jgi:hypothetical protein